MSKKVLIISSSPRKGGNSDTLCHQFQSGAESSGHSVDYIRLSDYHIQYCTGCAACHTTHQCIIRDDMEGLLQKMMDADVIVMATPVYFYAMSAQMKTFIDRCDSKYTLLKNKEFYFILTAADTDKDLMEKVLESFRGFSRDCLDGAVERGVIYGLGVWGPKEIAGHPALTEAYNMGASV